MGVLSIAALAALLMTGAVSAERVYKWVDENGVVHYSATPPEQELSLIHI